MSNSSNLNNFPVSLALASNPGLSMRSLLGKRSASPTETREESLRKRLAPELSRRSSFLRSNVDWFDDSRSAFHRRQVTEMDALAILQAGNTTRVMPHATGSCLLGNNYFPGGAALSPHAQEVTRLLLARRENQASALTTEALLSLFPHSSSSPAQDYISAGITRQSFAQVPSQAPLRSPEFGPVVPFGRESAPVSQVKSRATDPIEEAALSKMACMPLASEEDPNWLSEFHTFVRTELVEVCFATSRDVAARNISQQVFQNQVGIRCKCCANMTPMDRAPRSMAFPSSIGQIYQSFTMMLREHFSRCSGMPESIKEKFEDLKQGKTAQGATNSKEYWDHSARALGMQDTHRGIVMTERSRAAAKNLPPCGAVAGGPKKTDDEEPTQLLWDDEKSLTQSDYNFTLLRQVQRVHLQPDECRGNRKTLQTGLAGLGCKHCQKVGRMGQSRVFPVKKRSLSTKLEDMYQHLMRCTVCPSETKELLQIQRPSKIDLGEEDELYDIVWIRLKKNANAGRSEGARAPR